MFLAMSRMLKILAFALLVGALCHNLAAEAVFPIQSDRRNGRPGRHTGPDLQRAALPE